MGKQSPKAEREGSQPKSQEKLSNCWIPWTGDGQLTGVCSLTTSLDGKAWTSGNLYLLLAGNQKNEAWLETEINWKLRLMNCIQIKWALPFEWAGDFTGNRALRKAGKSHQFMRFVVVLIWSICTSPWDGNNWQYGGTNQNEEGYSSFWVSKM